MMKSASIMPIPATLVLLFLGGCQLPSPTSSYTTYPSLSEYVLSGYKSWVGVNGKHRDGEHGGIDFDGKYADPILATADGTVVKILGYACGRGVTISHPNVIPEGRYTIYCHMSKVAVSEGQKVKRGEVIGYIGISGNSAGVPHVHFEVSLTVLGHDDGYLKGSEDPGNYLVGCYDPEEIYDSSRLVLTAPISCGKGQVVKQPQ